MDSIGIFNGAHGAESFGFRNLQRVFWNGEAPALYEQSLRARRDEPCPGRRPPRRHRHPHRPLAEGQVHRPRRGDRGRRLVGEQRLHRPRRLRCAPRRLPCPCGGQRALRAGPLRRRRSEIPRPGPRLHRVCLALALHPEPSDPAGPRRPRGLRAEFDDRRPALLQGRSGPARLPLRDGDRLRLLPRHRADRRHQLCRRDEEVGLHLSQLRPAAEGRDADALLGECRRARRRRDVLRPLRHRQDDALRRSEPHPDRRRRARLGTGRRLQLRGRLLRQDDPAVARGRAGDLRDDASASAPCWRTSPSTRRRGVPDFDDASQDREHPLRLSARLHPERLARRAAPASRRTS